MKIKSRICTSLAQMSLMWIVLLCFLAMTFLSGFSVAKTNPVPYKNKIGLNVHWALGGGGKDGQYEKRLKQSKTKWVREHFQMEVLVGDNSELWFERYDLIIEKYKELDIKVIGMLAYNKDYNDFRVPNKNEWQEFVASVVNRYKDDVKVWEIWNEQDSPDYLTPNNPKAYASILKPAYRVIKLIDPQAKVITGGLSWPNIYFAKRMYKRYPNYFDGLGVHLYYGEEFYEEDKSLHALEFDLDRLRRLQKKYKPNHKIWITEHGCSTGGTGISSRMQKKYLRKSAPIILRRKWVKNILIYNIRNRAINDIYEDHFGLLKLDMSPRPSWRWYNKIKIGPYGDERIVKSEQKRLTKKLRKRLKKRYFKNKKARKKWLPKKKSWKWINLRDAYVYGGYKVKQAAYSLKFGKTVHYEIPFRLWKKTRDYKKTIHKKFQIPNNKSQTNFK